MSRKITVRILRMPDRHGKVALITREINEPALRCGYEVLGGDGKWREKGEACAIFDDEKFEIEED